MFNTEEIIGAYSEKLLRYATSILCNHQDAEDVLQQVFLAAYQKQDTFDGENLNAWLFKITLNKCLNFKKKRKLLFFSDVKNIPEQTENPFEEIESSGFLQLLERLSPHERALLHSRIVDEKSYDELSLIFGKSSAGLRKQFERAKKKVIKEYEREGRSISHVQAGCQ
jgi:RNA polymerase sigma-70 factor (ECF subfamily)